MKYYECSECGDRFLVRRIICPSCKSNAVTEKEFNTGKVLECVKLIATPEPYPAEYFLILAEYSGIKFFCRSELEIQSGAEIEVHDNEDGITCDLSHKS